MNMDLTQLGLSQNEAKAYETLLKLGKTTAAHISKESHVPYGRIYNVLSSLEEKGLVKVVPEKCKKFVPSDPEALDHYINKKKDTLDQLQKTITNYKSLYESHEEAVTLVKGERNFKKLALSMKPAKKHSYSVKLVFRTDPEFMRTKKQRVKSSVNNLTLGKFSKENEKAIKKWKKVQPNIKPIPNDGVVMSIRDEETLIALTKANTIMLIKDKPFAKMMARLFKNYYQNN